LAEFFATDLIYPFGRNSGLFRPLFCSCSPVKITTETPTSQYHGLSCSRPVNVTPIAPLGYLTRLQYSDVLHIVIIELIIHQYRGMQPAFDGGCKLEISWQDRYTKDLRKHSRPSYTEMRASEKADQVIKSSLVGLLRETRILT